MLFYKCKLFLFIICALFCCDKIFAKEVLFTTHQDAYHGIVNISPSGDQIKFNDGSAWKVVKSDWKKAQTWGKDDIGFLLPNSRSKCFPFLIKNVNTSQTIKCSLILSPNYLDPHSHHILSINYLTHEIFLEDGTHWLLPINIKASKLKEWQSNHAISIGMNDCPHDGKFSNILINVNTLTYFPAICL